VGGRLCAGDDAAEVGTFAPLEIPSDEKIAFRTHLQALRDWRRARAVIYRPAAAGDRVAVAQLCRHYDEVQAGCQHYLDNPEQGLILALEQEEVVGLACIAHRTWSHAANIDQVFVRPDYRRWGIGTQLVNHAVAYAREKGLRLLLAQAPVTNPILWVYIKAGFRVSGFVDAYYPPGREGPVTALFLAADL
jgi:GNAT superfamily N-acetyltransferase